MVCAWFRAAVCASLGLVVWGAHAATPATSAGALPRFQVSEAGDEVTDVQAKLVWRRCVEGMTWDGNTCTGKARLLDHSQAQALAKGAFESSKRPWRLPHVPELKRLIDGGQTPAAVDPVLFPHTPLQAHWSASTTVAGGGAFNPYNYGNIAQGRTSSSVNQVAFLHGWAVNFSTGEALGEVSKRTPLVVRLVRGAH